MAQRSDNIDRDGFRPNVGIIIQNDSGRLLWARRVGGHDAWQFPQGGILKGESPEDALFRELYEEVGLVDKNVEIRAKTRGWLRYRLPRHLRRKNSTPRFLGQKQRWFLLRLVAGDGSVHVSRSPRPEFDHWRWVSYWYPVGQVVPFKREVYRRALKELAPALQVTPSHGTTARASVASGGGCSVRGRSGLGPESACRTRHAPVPSARELRSRCEVPDTAMGR